MFSGTRGFILSAAAAELMYTAPPQHTPLPLRPPWTDSSGVSACHTTGCHNILCSRSCHGRLLASSGRLTERSAPCPGERCSLTVPGVLETCTRNPAWLLCSSCRCTSPAAAALWAPHLGLSVQAGSCLAARAGPARVPVAAGSVWLQKAFRLLRKQNKSSEASGMI